ncbi:MAG: major capsid protein [Rhodanobacter sp.]
MPIATQLSPGQARVVDPILSEHARGYRQPNLIARSLFPLAPVPMYGGKIIQFDKSAFKLVNTSRAPGTATKRIQFGYEGQPYAIVPKALEATVPRELMRDASVVPGIDLGTRAINTVLRMMQLGHEVDCATIARNAASYDVNHTLALAGGSVWSSATSTPNEDVQAAREAIRTSIGMYPNVCVLSAKALKNLKFNAEILNRIKYTSRDAVTTDILASLWEIPTVVVGQALSADDTDAFSDVWGADVVLAYVAPSGGGDASANAEEPSYAYTYLIEGMPLVEQPYWDANTKSWVYGVSFDYTPVLSGMQGGFLISGAGN